MKAESLVTAAHDRRRFLLLTLGSSVGFLVGTGPSALAQVSGDSPMAKSVLTEEIRLFFLGSIGERTPDREFVAAQWLKGERLFAEFVQIETEFFEIPQL